MESWILPECEARRWFIAAAVAGAIGLWISAASQILVLVSIGVAAILAVWTGKWISCDSKQITYAPALWWRWGMAGGCASLVTYLIEYFPNGFDWRLEVNHPLFALAWTGAGWLLAEGAMWRLQGRFDMNLRAWLVRTVAALALLLPLATVIATSQRTFWVADSFLFEFHRNYIEEFQPLFRTASDFNWVSFLMTLPFVAVPAMVGMAFRRTSRLEVNLLLLSFVPGGMMFLFALVQTRWCGVATGLILVGLIVAVGLAFDKKTLDRHRFWIAALVLVCASATPLWAIELWRNRTNIEVSDAYQVALRDLAHWLRMRAGDKPCVVACSPAISTGLVYDGGIQTLGTLYWENRIGLHETAALFAARTADEAYRIVQHHGVTQIVIISGDGFLQEYVRLVRNLPKQAEAPTDTFALDLIHRKILPPWLRMAPYRFPTNGPLGEGNVFVFEVVPPQTPVQADVAMTHFMIEMGEVKGVGQLVRILEKSPEDLAVWVARGRVALENEDQEAFSEAIEAIVKRRLLAGILSVEDRMHLANLLAVAGRVDLAKDEFDKCVPLLDEDTIRHLPASVLFHYLFYAPRLRATPPSERLLGLFAEMMPPGARAQLKSSVQPVSSQ